MKFTGDFHLHTYASDGHASVKDHVAIAKERGLKTIAITDHSFFTLFCHMTEKKFERQTAKIRECDGYGVEVLQGVEANLIGDKLDVPNRVIRKCDILIIGFHRFINPCRMGGESRFLLVNGFGSKKAKEKLVLKNTEAYVSAIENYPVDVIAHLLHRAPVDVKRVCECAAKNGVYIELNAKHVGALKEGIEDIIASGVNFIVGSDAHKKSKTGDFASVEDFIKKYRLPLERVFGIDGRTPTFKDKKEWNYGRNV